MAFISPALIARIYQALGQNRGSDAILLLRQHSFDGKPLPDAELIRALVRLADERYYNGDVRCAEDHFKLGLALYDGCFRDAHVEALRCVIGLMNVYSEQKRIGEMSALVRRTEDICAVLDDQYNKPKSLAV